MHSPSIAAIEAQLNLMQHDLRLAEADRKGVEDARRYLVREIMIEVTIFVTVMIGLSLIILG